MDLQEKTRMQDTYVRIENIVDSISKLGVFPPLVWVYTWDVARTMFTSYMDGEDPDYRTTMKLDELWERFWIDADTNGFSLQYGVEDLDDAVRDWLMDIGAVESVEDEDNE